MSGLSLNISTTRLNINGLNKLIKSQTLGEELKNNDPPICSLQALQIQ